MKTRLGLLDSLRGLAAVLVLLQHLYERRAGVVGHMIALLSPGVAGVALFFLVSGYVIPMSVRAPFAPGAFLVRRLFRIYPLYVAALGLIVTLAASGLLPPFAWILASSPRTLFANLLLVQDYVAARSVLGVSWTLPIEVAWYALFAGAVVLWRERAGAHVAVLAPLGMLAVIAASLAWHVRLPLGRFSMIYAAALGYDVYRHRIGAITVARLVAAVTAFVVIVGTADYVAFGLFHHERLTLWQVVIPWAAALSVFLVAMLTPALRDWRILAVGPLPALGAMSYSTYLLHPIALTAARLYAAPPWVDVAALAGTLLLTVTGYRLVEQPGIRIGRRLATTSALPLAALHAA